MASLPKRAGATTAQKEALTYLTKRTRCKVRLQQLPNALRQDYLGALASVGNLYLETVATCHWYSGLRYCLPDDALAPGLPKGTLVALRLLELNEIEPGSVVVRVKNGLDRRPHTMLEMGYVVAVDKDHDCGIALYRPGLAATARLHMRWEERGYHWYGVESVISLAA